MRGLAQLQNATVLPGSDLLPVKTQTRILSSTSATSFPQALRHSVTKLDSSTDGQYSTTALPAASFRLPSVDRARTIEPLILLEKNLPTFSPQSQHGALAQGQSRSRLCGRDRKRCFVRVSSCSSPIRWHREIRVHCDNRRVQQASGDGVVPIGSQQMARSPAVFHHAGR